MTSVGHTASKEQSQDYKGLGLSTTMILVSCYWNFPEIKHQRSGLVTPRGYWPAPGVTWPIQPCKPSSSDTLKGGLPYHISHGIIHCVDCATSFLPGCLLVCLAFSNKLMIV